MRAKRRKTKSPLKTKPLRLAGQSVSEELDKVVETDMTSWAVVIILAVFLAIFEWIRWWGAISPQPLLVSILAVVACGLAVWKIRKMAPHAHNLNLGRQGEIIVSQCLDKLKANGYRVFADVVGDGFNVDHVLVGPGGVFAIETKTRRKPEGDARVIYDGNKLTVNGHIPDRDPIVQVKAASRYVRDIIEPVVSDIDVQPVVIFPGWFVDHTGSLDVWVFNEKHFLTWMEDRWRRLSDDNVRLISRAIEVHVRGNAT